VISEVVRWLRVDDGLMLGWVGGGVWGGGGGGVWR